MDVTVVCLYGQRTVDSAEPFLLFLLHIKSFTLTFIVREEMGHDSYRATCHQGEQLHTRPIVTRNLIWLRLHATPSLCGVGGGGRL